MSDGNNMVYLGMGLHGPHNPFHTPAGKYRRTIFCNAEPDILALVPPKSKEWRCEGQKEATMAKKISDFHALSVAYVSPGTGTSI